MINSENLGARSVENGALDRKIMALEAFKGKMVLLGGSGFVELSGWKALARKNKGSCRV
jgi:hypothetical protein